MSVTAVPIRPIARGSLLKLFAGLALLVLVAGAVAWAGTSGQQITTTASGLRFQVIKQGTGPTPTTQDVVAFNYEGRLEDGTVFDSSAGRQPMITEVSGLVPGFTEGLQLMKKGGRYRLVIPPALGYGAGSGPIPPNATLTFDVELLEVVPKSALQGMGPPPGQGGAGGPGGR
jgi:FKBP-type peptidyl-prolyl cis-trans isomerase FkpA